MPFWKDGFSIDESKVSATVILFIATVVVGIIQYFMKGDITSNWLIVIQTFVASIAGVNISNQVSQFINNKVQSTTTQQSQPQTIVSENKNSSQGIDKNTPTI